MKSSTIYRMALLVLGALAFVTPAFSQNKAPLSEKENPELIGKRNINKHQIDFYSLDKEVALGRQLAAEIDHSAKFVEDPVIVEYVNRVGQNLALHSDAKFPLTIKVIESDEVNAFTLPGGFLYVNKGLILAADNESELAGPIAHEIGHAAARHGVEQASKGQLANYASLPLIFLGGYGGFAIRQAAGLLIPVGFLKFSRGAEEEADLLGAQYMWAAGYDPHSLVTFFEKLQAKEKKKPGTISKLFSTHPMVGDRIAKVNSLVARFPDRTEYTINTSEFDQVKGRLVTSTNARARMTSHGGTSAEQDSKRPTLKRRQPAPPDSADTSGGQTTTTGDQPPASDRPTLRRRSDTTDPAKTDESAKPTPTPTPKPTPKIYLED